MVSRAENEMLISDFTKFGHSQKYTNIFERTKTWVTLTENMWTSFLVVKEVYFYFMVDNEIQSRSVYL